MKIHHMWLKGIGPFAGEEHVDFSVLGQSIFLIEGPTGSGKTTLIDALTWALYGSVAGGEDSTDQRIRSTHANPREESFVELVFTVSGGNYRVRRTPAWTKEGNKNPTAATAKLWKLHEGALEAHAWEESHILETKPRDVAKALTELIGLSCKQFVQTMVLPQGKFAHFLKLDSQERTTLLQQIFATTAYKRLTEELQRRAGDMSEREGNAHEGFVRAVAAVAALGEKTSEKDTDDVDSAASPVRDLVDRARALELPEHATEIRHALTTQIAAQEAQVDQLYHAYTQAQVRTQNAHEAREEARAIEALLAERTDLLTRKEAHKAREADVALLITQREKHERAAALTPQLRTLERATTEENTAEEQLALAIADLHPSQHEESTAALSLDISTLEALLSHHQELKGRLSQISSIETEFTSAQQKCETLREEKAEANSLIAEYKEALARIPEQMSTVESQLREGEEATSELPRTLNELSQAREREAVLRTHEELNKQRATLEKEISQIRTQAAAALETFSSTSAAWMRAAAGNLAIGLVDSQPCPVCGSREHPHLAEVTEEAPSEADLTAASKKVQEAQASLAAQEERLRKVREELGAHGELPDPDELAAHIVSLNAQKERLDTAVQALPEARAKRSEIEESRVRLTSQLSAVQAAQEARHTSLNSLVERIDNLDRLLAQHRGGYGSISERQEEVTSRIATTQALLASTRLLADARSQLTEAHEEGKRAWEAAGFTNREQICAAHLDEEALTQLNSQIEEYLREGELISQGLARKDIATLTGTEKPQYELRNTEYLVAQEEESEANRAYAARKALLDRARILVTTVEDSQHAWEQSHKESGAIVRLANLACAGKSSLTHVPLATYVLQQRFEDIVARANEHLARISLGRYELERTDDKEQGTRKTRTGLGLLIVDHMGESSGDSRRSPRSVSGGESFYTSLSLALALADVVQAENGGIRLDTLMIDEGFGSLDAVTLDSVMHVLIGLAEGGRSVGIISHVEELRRMIPERLTVLPHHDGTSSLTVASSI